MLESERVNCVMNCRRRIHDLKSLGKAAQTSRTRATTFADHRLVVRSLERKQFTPSHRTQHHRTHNRARLACHCAHVKHVVRSAMRLHHAQQPLAVNAPIAQLHALHGGEGTRGRGNHPRAHSRGHAIAYLPRRLQQFRRHQCIQRTGHRVQTEHRPLAAELGDRRWEHLNVVSGSARALRHTRNRRALRCVACVVRRGNDPLGQHTAAFATEGAN